MPRSLAIILSLFLSFSVWSNPRKDTLEKRKEGDRFLAEGNYENALKAYEDGLRIQNDPSLHIARASALLKLRRYQEAKEAYESYLQFDIKATRKSEAQKAIQEIEKILATTLFCTSTPAGATVYLDSLVDGTLGVTPLEFYLAPGHHRVIFEHAGFLRKVESIEVPEGERKEITTTLTALPFSFTIESQPDGAEVFLEKEVKGVTPLSLEFPAGSHLLTLRKEGFSEKQQLVEGNPGDKLSYFVTFQENPSKLQLILTPKETQIALSGVMENFVSGTYSMSPGKYHLFARAKGYYDKEIDVTILRGETNTVVLALEPLPSSLQIKTNEENFRVFLNEEEQLWPKSKPLGLHPGSYTLRVESTGKTAYETPFTIENGELLTASVDLQKPRSKIMTSLFIGTAVVSAFVGTVGTVSFFERRQNSFVREDSLRPAIVADVAFGISIGTGILAFRNLLKTRTSKGSISSEVRENP